MQYTKIVVETSVTLKLAPLMDSKAERRTSLFCHVSEQIIMVPLGKLLSRKFIHSSYGKLLY